ncbi:MAG: anti-sigma F factor [Ruminococcaceae bacterium]|nr:anti-sigma F factor [Oscillospiraceae bacterium]
MKKIKNAIKAQFPSISENEALSRMIIMGFISRTNVTAEDMADIKTMVSEAVTNCIVHAYKDSPGKITMEAKLFEDMELVIRIKDTGCGIEDMKKAMEPFYTTDALGERCGMGLCIMKSFSDKFSIKSTRGKGTTVTMRKLLAK